MATTTFKEVMEQPSSNVTVAEGLQEVSKPSPEEEQSVVSEANVTDDNESEETEDSPVIDNEPVVQTSLKLDSHQVVQESSVIEMPSMSSTTEVLNEQSHLPEMEIRTDS